MLGMFGKKAPAAARAVSAAGTPADGAPRMGQDEWLSHVMSRQSAQMTPEIRAKIQRRAEVSARAHKHAKRAGRMQMCSAMTQQSWARGMRAQSNAMAAPAAMRQEAAESAQMEMRVLQRAMSEEDEDAAEEQFGGQLMALQQVAAADEADVSEIQALLQQLMVEPEEDEERIRKFGLYETLLETVEAARKTTFEFYDGCKADFADAGGESVQATIERSLAGIDGGDNMAVDFREDRWFVYDMTRKADSNNSMLGRVLADIKTKLDLIAQHDDCPICLESMEGMNPENLKVLGCCHKVCGECWAQWQAIKHGHGFCPLCKHEEFLGDVCEGHALPPALFARVHEQIAAPAGPAAGGVAPQTSWPELVGRPGAEAVAAISAARPELEVVLMDAGGMMTMDLREDRVRVMVTSAGAVAQPPQIG